MAGIRKVNKKDNRKLMCVVQVQDRTKLNGIHQAVVCIDYVNLLGINPNTT
jgi:hypothetical protein